MIRVSIATNINLGIEAMLVCRSLSEAAFSAAGLAVGALISANARADNAAADPEDKLQSVEVTGTAIHMSADISQSSDSVDKKELAEQNLALVQDALRNVPGITLNSGEGGAHGDSVNLRGLSIPDSFFMDGVRDIGQYQRDTFNSERSRCCWGRFGGVRPRVDLGCD